MLNHLGGSYPQRVRPEGLFSAPLFGLADVDNSHCVYFLSLLNDLQRELPKWQLKL